mmetsp:Transcript_75752/g.225841  ORF Transcript_75752/g.225841 Transcript_75752/m.225841 type:complete len:168 (-) Transcript_75752:51-554(-)
MLVPQPQVFSPVKEMSPLDPEELKDVCCRSLDLAIDTPVRSAAIAAGLEADGTAAVTTMEGAVTPRGLAAGAWTTMADDGQVWSAKAAARYGDKAKGMSLHDRLSQLEFSDEEDESPRSKANTQRSGAEGKPPVERQASTPGGEPPAPTVEACQAFVPPSSDSDEED